MESLNSPHGELLEESANAVAPKVVKATLRNGASEPWSTKLEDGHCNPSDVHEATREDGGAESSWNHAPKDPHPTHVLVPPSTEAETFSQPDGKGLRVQCLQGDHVITQAGERRVCSLTVTVEESVAQPAQKWTLGHLQWLDPRRERQHDMADENPLAGDLPCPTFRQLERRGRANGAQRS